MEHSEPQKKRVHTSEPFRAARNGAETLQHFPASRSKTLRIGSLRDIEDTRIVLYWLLVHGLRATKDVDSQLSSTFEEK